MNTLKIIAFHPERLREMILGNERKAVASLTTFGLIVYLLLILSNYAFFLLIPVPWAEAVDYLDDDEKAIFFARFEIREYSWTTVFIRELISPGTTDQSLKIKRATGTLSAEGVGQFLISAGNKKLGKRLIRHAKNIEEEEDIFVVLSITVFTPIVILLGSCTFAFFLAAYGISFSQTAFMSMYVSLFWQGVYDILSFIYVANPDSIFMSWFSALLLSAICIATFIHYTWFFMHSHNKSARRVIMAYIYSALTAAVITFVGVVAVALS